MQQNLHQSPPLTGGDYKLRPKSGRKPLQPKNSLPNSATNEIQILKPKPKQESVEILSESNNKNKENHPIFATPTTKTTKVVIEPLLLDASLAEELSAIRKKVERLRAEKEKTEKMLNDREKFLDLKMKEMDERSLIQKRLEIEVDRLFRLKELHSSCSMRISPIRSLREREHEKKNSQVHWQGIRGEEEGMEESKTASGFHSPCLSSSSKTVSGLLHSPCMSSSSSSNSVSSQLVEVK